MIKSPSGLHKIPYPTGGVDIISQNFMLSNINDTVCMQQQLKVKKMKAAKIVHVMRGTKAVQCERRGLIITAPLGRGISL